MRNQGVHLLDHFHLGIEIPVFTPRVGWLHMHKKEVKLTEIFSEGRYFLLNGIRLRADYHTQKPGNAAVHGVAGNSQCVKAEPFTDRGVPPISGIPAQQQHVRLWFI